MTQHFFKIVGLIGRYNSGKDTAADLFVEYDFKKIALADPLKMLLHDYFDIPINELYGPSQNRTERTRKMLQHLGTDFARTFDPDIWVNKMIKKIEAIRSSNIPSSGVVISDVRFPNEAQAIVDMGGQLVKITPRPHYDTYTDSKIREHYSEVAVDTISDALIFATVHNNGTLDEFKEEITRVINIILS